MNFRTNIKRITDSNNGNERFGIFKGDGVVNLGRGIKARRLREAIANEPDALAAHAGDSVDHPLSEIRFLPPIPDPGLLICLGLNTYSHLKEAREFTGREKPPAKPWAFIRSPRSITGDRKRVV